VLNRWPDNFFAETEQVAFCPANIVPGIDFSDDPLLQGRLFSYLDTQLSRLGGPNFHEIPINRPICPFQNFQRDGHMRHAVAKGRVNYEPNSLGPEQPRECPVRGFRTTPREVAGTALRARAESFADPYSQARLFFRSQTPPEQNHIVAALCFELSKVETPPVRARVVSHLHRIDPELGKRVARGLGLEGSMEPAPISAPARDMEPSPALSIIAKAEPTLEGRIIGCLVTDGSDGALIEALRNAVEKACATLRLVAPRIAGLKTSNGKPIMADFRIDGGPSVFFDAVVVAPSEAGAARLENEAAAIDFIRDAYGHLKIIARVPAAERLLRKAGLAEGDMDEGMVAIEGTRGVGAFIASAKKHRIWEREPKVRSVP
jgi:catalase